MNCDQTRQLLGPLPRPQPHSGDTEAAWAHYAECWDCRTFYANQEHLGRRLGQLAELRAPAALRARIEAAIASEATDSRTWPVRWRAGLSALVVTAAAAVIVLVAAPRDTTNIAAPLAAAAREELEQSARIVSEDFGEIERWLATEVGYPVEVPVISDAVLVGARVTSFGEGEKSAAVVYLSRGMPVTYFALPSDMVLGKRLRSDRVMAATADGYEVALWTEEGRARAIAAPMSRDQVVQIAEECRSKASLN